MTNCLTLDRSIARRCALPLGLALWIQAMAVGAVWPQSVTDGPPPANPPVPVTSEQRPDAPSPPNGDSKPGLIEEMGKLLEKSMSVLPPLKSPSETLEDLSTRAKDTTKDVGDGLTRLTTPPLVVTGRAACPLAPNRGPDCKAGADRLCQSKGYKEGKSLDTDAAEKCSAKVYLPGHKREPGDCRIENFVTRALCQ